MLLAPLVITASLAAPLPSVPATAGLEWNTGPLTSALGRAAQAEKPVLVYFWSNQSGQCARLYQETLTQPAVEEALGAFVPYSADTGQDAGYALVERFGVKSLPTMLVLTPSGEVDDAILGYIGVEGLVDELARIQRGEKTVSALREATAATPEDLELALTFAIKLSDVGDVEGFEAERARIYGVDPKYAQLPTAQLRLYELQEAAGSSEEELLVADLEPLQKFLNRDKHGEVLFAGWSWVAEVSAMQEKPEATRAAQVAMWEHVPEASVARTGDKIARGFYEQREELSKKERRFALEVAEAVVASVESWSTSEGCGEGCYCDGCTEGCVGEGEMLAKRELYVARALDTLACAYAMNGKRKDALAAIDRSLTIDPENEHLQARREELAQRG